MVFAGVKDPATLLEHIRDAEDMRRRRLKQRRERLLRMAGPASGVGDSAYEPENVLYEYVAFVLPRCAGGDPKVSVRSRGSGIMDILAQGMEYAMNRVCHDLKLRRPIRSLCLNYLMDFSAALIVPEEMAWRPGGRRVFWPVMSDLDVNSCFMDPLARRPDLARFIGHGYVMDKDDLERIAREDNGESWNLKEVLDLPTDYGLEVQRGESVTMRDGPPRNEVALYDVWIPEVDESMPDEWQKLAKGTIYTIGTLNGMDSDEAWGLRPPRPWYGSVGGPYRIGAYLWNPEVPYGLSPTTPMEQQIQSLSKASRSLDRAMEKYKVMTTYDAADGAQAQALINAPGQYALPIKGDPQKYAKLEIGGATQQHVAQRDIRRQTVDRGLGMSDTQRGLVTGEGTASEVLTAAAGADTRMGDVEGQFMDYLQDCLEAMAEIMWDDDRFLVTVDGELQGLFGKNGFQGGASDDPELQGMTWDDMEMEVKPYSTMRETQATRAQRAQTTMDMVGFFTQAITANPDAWDWKRVIARVGEQNGLDSLEDLVDVEAARAAAGAQGQGKPDVRAVMGRQATGRPINVTMKAAGRGRSQSGFRGGAGGGYGGGSSGRSVGRSGGRSGQGLPQAQKSGPIGRQMAGR